MDGEPYTAVVVISIPPGGLDLIGDDPTHLQDVILYDGYTILGLVVPASTHTGREYPERYLAPGEDVDHLVRQVNYAAEVLDSER